MPDPDPRTLAYLVLKTAHGLYGKGPARLTPAEHDEVLRNAHRQARIESRVFATEEARSMAVPAASVEAAVQAVRAQYACAQEFHAELQANGLDEAAYAQALERELRVQAVLERVGEAAATVTEADVALYYHYHPEEFRRPERRRARHILVTINEAIAENRRTTARSRIEAIARRVHKDPRRFEDQAVKHSECPTALRYGLLGNLRRGELYPELDAVLFELGPMEVGPVTESPLGFHLLRCDEIQPETPLTLDQTWPAIRRLLEQRRRESAKREWVRRLLDG